jgi:hypothetical protein
MDKMVSFLCNLDYFRMHKNSKVQKTQNKHFSKKQTGNWACPVDMPDYSMIYLYCILSGRLYGLVIIVFGYISRDLGPIPGFTRFFLGGSGTGSTQPLEDN